MPLLHHWPSPSLPLLASHLAPHLPVSLPSYNTVLLPNPTVTFHATFPPDASPPNVWVLLADFGNQVRPFCSLESGAGGETQEAGEELLLSALAEWFRALPAERDGAIRRSLSFFRRWRVIKRCIAGPISIGAVHERWIPLMRWTLSPTSVGEYKTHLAPEGKAEREPRRLPEGVTVGEARPQDIDEVGQPLPAARPPWCTNLTQEIGSRRSADLTSILFLTSKQILSTSEVAHPPSYLLNRLPFSTALFLSTPSSPLAEPLLIASCFTHRDGCLGTLHVSPSHRRQGLARIIIEAREKRLQEQGGEGVRGFAHVALPNEESRGLMRAMRWEENWGVAWVRCERSVWEGIE